MTNTIEIKDDVEAYEFKEMYEAGDFKEEAYLSKEVCMSYYAK